MSGRPSAGTGRQRNKGVVNKRNKKKKTLPVLGREQKRKKNVFGGIPGPIREGRKEKGRQRYRTKKKKMPAGYRTSTVSWPNKDKKRATDFFHQHPKRATLTEEIRLARPTKEKELSLRGTKTGKKMCEPPYSQCQSTKEKESRCR